MKRNLASIRKQSLRLASALILSLGLLWVVPAVSAAPAGGADEVMEWKEDARRPGAVPAMGGSAESVVDAWNRDWRRPDSREMDSRSVRVDWWRVDDRRPAPWPKQGMDTDRDGVMDHSDMCPGTPLGAWVDASGCPRDGDQDEVYDGLDRCPDTPRGASVDSRGCPSDSDGDGVLNGIDRCPDTPGGTAVNASGCSDDDDGDGVPNDRDKCPNTPAGTRVDIRGCPMSSGHAQLVDAGILRLSLHFDTNRATLKSQSHARLDEVGQILADHPDVKVEIGGHTDSQGDDGYNQTLSRDRAETVRSYWLSKYPQIRSENLVARGYGESQPVGSNDTPEGRAENRRVEVRVLNPEVLR